MRPGLAAMVLLLAAGPRQDWSMEPHRHRMVVETAGGVQSLVLHGLKIYKDNHRDFDHSMPMTFTRALGGGPIALTFLSSAERWEFQESRSLVLDLDGAELTPGPVQYAGRTICVTVQEKLDLSLELADLERLVSARKVTGTLGPFSFTLDDGHLRVLADYLRRCRTGDLDGVERPR